MKIKVLISMALMAFLLCGCSLKMRTTSYGNYEPQNTVKIIQNGQVIPDDAIRIGCIETGDRGTTSTKNCTYASSIEAIVKAAKKMGGNIVYIVSIKEPTWASSCYQITADVYLQKNDCN